MISLVTRSLTEDMKELRRLKCISEFFGISKPVLELISKLQYFDIQFRYFDTSNQFYVWFIDRPIKDGSNPMTGSLKMLAGNNL